MSSAQRPFAGIDLVAGDDDPSSLRRAGLAGGGPYRHAARMYGLAYAVGHGSMEEGDVVIDADVGTAAPAAVKTILIVEDEVLVRMHLATALEDEGYLVIQAANAAEALV